MTWLNIVVLAAHDLLFPKPSFTNRKSSKLGDEKISQLSKTKKKYKYTVRQVTFESISIYLIKFEH